jgi:cytidylate kinase
MTESNRLSHFHIAIDGPVAAGKGTVSRLVAERLGFLYVDTGAMYRMTAYLAHENGVDFLDEAAIVNLIKNSAMDMRNPNEDEQDGRLITVFLNGEDVSWKIRTAEMSTGASHVSTLSEVRKILVEKQKEIAQGKDVVMEGRDITYRVLPNAHLKIFLTANAKARAERRLLQFQQKGIDTTLEKVMNDMADRDQRDMGRSADPLQIVPDAWQLDTSDKSIESVVDEIVEKVQSMRK